MARISPFRAVRPKPELAAQVAAPPYDAISLEEARKMAKGNPHCFLRVSRAELELNNEVDPYSSEVYERGAKKLQTLIKDGILIQEEYPLFGVYRQKWGSQEQTGLVALVSVDEYNRGIIKKHELTRPVKENDRVRIIETHESQSGPALLFFHRTKKLKHWLKDITSTRPDFKFIASDEVEHTVWSIREQSAIQKLVEDFKEINTLYIADGHHRSAAASRAKFSRNYTNITTDNRDEGILAVIFPHDELTILPYNRVVQSLNNHTPTRFLAGLALKYELTAAKIPGNPPPGGFDMYLEGRWHRAKPKKTQGQFPKKRIDSVDSLAISILTKNVLEPLLGIKDQRSSPRIDFVSGVRNPHELATMVDQGDWAAAFWIYPITITELMAVSDTERIMPPKSTWFEPKLQDGLFLYMMQEK